MQAMVSDAFFVFIESNSWTHPARLKHCCVDTVTRFFTFRIARSAVIKSPNFVEASIPYKGQTALILHLARAITVIVQNSRLVNTL